MRFGPVTMLVALVIGLGAGLGVMGVASGGDDDSNSSGFISGSTLAKIGALIAGKVKIAAQNDGKGGLKVQLAGDEKLAADNQNLLYSPYGAKAVPGLSASPILSDAAAEVISVGSGNVVSVGSGNILSNGSSGVISVGAGNVISVGSGNVVSVGSGNLRTLPNAVVSTNSGAVISVGSGNLGTQMSRYQTTEETLPITQQGCSDPWLSKAIDARTHTGTPPDGGFEAMCSPQLIGLSPGQYFVNKDQYTKAVNDFFATKCPDIWVTRAIMEVTNRQPNGPECEIWRYNNGHWGSYTELKKYVQQAGLYTRPRASG
jgi:hypothetical protein